MSTFAGIELQIVHSVREIGPGAWDNLSGRRGFASHRWHQFGEAVLRRQRPVYVLAHCRGRPVGRAAFWLTHDIPLPGVSRPLRRALQAALGRWPALICRSPLVDCSGLILPEPPLRDAVRAAIIDGIQAWARQNRASFVVLDYLSQNEAQTDTWAGEFAPAVVQDPGTALALGWRDFDGWLGSLRSAARKSYRHNCEQAARLGLQIECLRQPPSVSEALGLVGQVESRYGSPTPWARAMLEHFGMVDGTWISVNQHGHIRAGCLFLRDGPEAALTLLARDYSVPYAYFQLFYQGIRLAIESGAQCLRGGSGALELKRRLGFQPQDNNHVAYAATGPLLGWLGRLAA